MFNNKVIYSSEPEIKTFGKMIKNMILDVKKSKDLSFTLAKRDIKGLYRQSFLGYVWAFILPLVNTFIWLFLQGNGMIEIKDTSVPYPIYVFTGTILWQIFTEAFQSPVQEVTASKGMLTKLNFPREAIILSGVYKSLFNSLIKLIILIPIVLFLGLDFSTSILLLPLGVVSITLAGISLGMFLVPIGALYNDIAKTIPILTQFLMFFSPVVFAIPLGGMTRMIFLNNPLTYLVVVPRDWLTNVANDYLGTFLWINVSFLILLLVGWVMYRVTMPILIQRMSA